MTRLAYLLVATAAVFLLGGCESSPEGPLLETQTVNGAIAGVEQDGVAAYLGVPFAAPPVGDLRWKHPQPVTDWEGVRQANRYGGSCMQQRYEDGITNSPWTKEYMVDPNSEITEDCLYLNVWTPAKSAEERLPVFFWIHGGGWNQGSGSLLLYSGKEMANNGVVFVNVNYRLGLFGLLPHPELTAEAGTSGNYGVADLVAALEWVRDNIENFGGDPNRVTIAGQSAGSRAVHFLTYAPKAKGLFHAIIPQSGSRVTGNSETREQAEERGVAFMKAVGASSLAELRAMSAEELETAMDKGVARFQPIIDGELVPLDAAEVYAQATYPDTPVLTGFTADEGSSRPDYGQDTAAEFQASVRERYGDLADRFLEIYPAPDDAAAGEATKQLARDANIATMYLWSKRRMETSKQPIYGYLFTRTLPGPKSDFFGAFHSAELAYEFNTLDVLEGRDLTEADDEIASHIIRYWTNFAKTGNPNGEGLPAWPQLDFNRKQIMELGSGFAPRPALSNEKLALFEEAMGR